MTRRQLTFTKDGGLLSFIRVVAVFVVAAVLGSQIVAVRAAQIVPMTKINAAGRAIALRDLHFASLIINPVDSYGARKESGADQQCGQEISGQEVNSQNMPIPHWHGWLLGLGFSALIYGPLIWFMIFKQ